MPLPSFQQFLIDNGYKRTRLAIGSKTEKVEDYESVFLSTYGPTEYCFKKGNNFCFFGLVEVGKPPVMHLGDHKMKLINGGKRTIEDGYRILFSVMKEQTYPAILEAFESKNGSFVVDLTDEKSPKILILP